MKFAVIDGAAFVKVSGRASFSSSVEFKCLIMDLREKGIPRFVLDLSECITMDSTFLGVLSGFALKLSEDNRSNESMSLALLNPNQRVADLLENLGVIDLFKILKESNPATPLFEPVLLDRPDPTKLEISQTCLEAHQTLMQANPENIPRFKEVTQFLAKDLNDAKP